MSNKDKLGLIILIILASIIIITFVVWGANFAVLNPKGSIAQKERNLLYFAVGLSLLVVIPVFVMTAVIAFKYRENNTSKKLKYQPEWDHSPVIETVWWAIPITLITILSIITWNSSHALDPFRSINSNVKPITIQVVAMEWKWLFIYPGQKVASINFAEVPVNTPINFEITSDAPMNSFWVPQLGGQIYAMSGMSTELHLIANQVGAYRGQSANISGDGFSGMKFTIAATDTGSFKSWIDNLKNSAPLDSSSYSRLAKPTSNNPISYYSLSDTFLYSKIVLKYSGGDQVSGVLSS